MTLYLKDKYINLLTDFGFKRVFGTELNKHLLILPKFKKSLGELKSHGDKWLFILKNLAELTDRPTPLQEGVFNELFDVAEIANFSAMEQDGYQNSLKYYRDLNNVVDTSRAEGVTEGLAKGKLGLLLGMLSMKLGDIPELTITTMESLSPELLDELGKALFGFGTIVDLNQWLTQHKVDR